MEIQGVKNSPIKGAWQNSLDRSMPRQMSPHLKEIVDHSNIYFFLTQTQFSIWHFSFS